MSQVRGFELRPIRDPPSTCPLGSLSVFAFVGGPPNIVGRASIKIPDPLISRHQAQIRAHVEDGNAYLEVTCVAKNRMQVIFRSGKTKLFGQGGCIRMQGGDKIALYYPGTCLLEAVETDGEGCVNVDDESRGACVVTAAPPPQRPPPTVDVHACALARPGQNASSHDQSPLQRSSVIVESRFFARRNPDDCVIPLVVPVQTTVGPLPSSFNIVGATCDVELRHAVTLEPEPSLPPAAADSVPRECHGAQSVRSTPGGSCLHKDCPLTTDYSRRLGADSAPEAHAAPCPSSVAICSDTHDPSCEAPTGDDSAPCRVRTAWEHKIAAVSSAVKIRRAATGIRNEDGDLESPYFSRRTRTPSQSSQRGGATAGAAMSSGTRTSALAVESVAAGHKARFAHPESLVVDLTSPAAAAVAPPLLPANPAAVMVLNAPIAFAPPVGLALPRALLDPASPADNTDLEVAELKPRPEQAAEECTDLCPVCREVLQTRERVGLLPCAHVFCLDCITAWSRITNHCCLCKREFEAITELRKGACGSAKAAAMIPRAFSSAGFSMSAMHTVAFRRQPVVAHHVDDDSALAWRLAMEEGFEAADEDDSGRRSVESVVVLSVDDDAGWNDPRVRQRSGGRGGQHPSRGSARRGQSSAYFVHGSPSQSSSESSSDASGRSADSQGGGAVGQDYHCRVCGDDGHADVLLLCDGCNVPQHTFCCSPPLSAVPDGLWLCHECSLRHTRECPTLPRPVFVLQLQAEASAAAARRLVEISQTVAVAGPVSAAAAATSPLAPPERCGDPRSPQSSSHRSQARRDRFRQRRTDLDYLLYRRRLLQGIPTTARSRPESSRLLSAHAAPARHFGGSGSGGADSGAPFRPLFSAAASRSTVSALRPNVSVHSAAVAAGSSGAQDLLVGALRKSRAERHSAATLPRGDMAHALDSSAESAHVLVPVRHLQAEERGAARRGAANVLDPDPVMSAAGLAHDWHAGPMLVGAADHERLNPVDSDESRRVVSRKRGRAANFPPHRRQRLRRMEESRISRRHGGACNPSAVDGCDTDSEHSFGLGDDER